MYSYNIYMDWFCLSLLIQMYCLIFFSLPYLLDEGPIQWAEMVSLHNYIKTPFTTSHHLLIVCHCCSVIMQRYCTVTDKLQSNAKASLLQPHHFSKLILFGSASIFSYQTAERISLSLSWCGRECLQEICSILWSFSLTIAIYQRGINFQAPQGAWCYACSLFLNSYTKVETRRAE